MCCWTICHSGMESIFWIWLCSIFPEAANELQSFRWPLYQHKGPVLPVATANLLTRCRRDSTLSYQRSSDSRANSRTPSYSHRIKTSFSILFCFLTCSMRATVIVRGLSQMDQWIKPDSLFSPCQSVIYSERPVIGSERRLSITSQESFQLTQMTREAG